MKRHFIVLSIAMLVIMFSGNCVTVFTGLSNYETHMKDSANVNATFKLPENICELEASDLFMIQIEEATQKTIMIYENYNNQKEFTIPLIADRKYNISTVLNKPKPFRYHCQIKTEVEKKISLEETYEQKEKSEIKKRYIATVVYNFAGVIYFWLFWPIGIWPSSFYETTLPIVEVTEYKKANKTKAEPSKTQPTKSKFNSVVVLKDGRILKNVGVVVTSDSVVVMTEDGTSTVYKKSEVKSVKK